MTLDWAQWGTVPEWVAAVGTVGGLWYALRLFNRESLARREQDEDRLREQARYIAVWIDEYDRLILRNGSGEPAYRVEIYHSREEGYEDRLPLLYETELLPPRTQIDTEAEVPTPMGTREYRLAFIDARGIRWVRESGGVLIRIDPGLDVGKVGVSRTIRGGSAHGLIWDVSAAVGHAFVGVWNWFGNLWRGS